MPQLDEKGAAKLRTVEGHIARLERELKAAQETRRELINYYGLNKCHDSTGKASIMSHKA